MNKPWDIECGEKCGIKSYYIDSFFKGDNMKKIYINGRFLTQNITGVQRYAIEIVKALDKYLNDNRLNGEYKFEIVCPKNIKQELVLRNINIKQIGKLKGHLWEQIELPLYVKDKFLFNFCNCAPLIKKIRCL